MMTKPICGVCGRESDDLHDPPTFTYVEDERGRLKPVLNKPIRMDPETGAVCWCSEAEANP